MFDYKNLTNSGSKKVFEPIYDLLSQILNENESEKDLTPSEWESVGGAAVVAAVTRIYKIELSREFLIHDLNVKLFIIVFFILIYAYNIHTI